MNNQRMRKHSALQIYMKKNIYMFERHNKIIIELELRNYRENQYKRGVHCSSFFCSSVEKYQIGTN